MIAAALLIALLIVLAEMSKWKERATKAESRSRMLAESKINILMFKMEVLRQDREIAELKERVKVLQGEMGS